MADVPLLTPDGHDARDHTGITGVGGGGSLGAWTSFTPDWNTASTQPSIGNGTLTGRYKALDATTYVIIISLTWGSTTTPGTGTWRLGNLPFTSKSTAPAYQVCSAFVLDAGTASFSASARLPAGTSQFDAIVVADATSTRHAAAGLPITWATGDVLVVQGIFESD